MQKFIYARKIVKIINKYKSLLLINTYSLIRIIFSLNNNINQNNLFIIFIVLKSI